MTAKKISDWIPTPIKMPTWMAREIAYADDLNETYVEVDKVTYVAKSVMFGGVFDDISTSSIIIPALAITEITLNTLSLSDWENLRNPEEWISK